MREGKTETDRSSHGEVDARFFDSCLLENVYFLNFISMHVRLYELPSPDGNCVTLSLNRSVSRQECHMFTLVSVPICANCSFNIAMVVLFFSNRCDCDENDG